MKSDSREFFEQLANLFYALAVDRSIEPIEFSELKMLISKEWMAHPQDSNLPIPENVHLMFVEMDTLQATQVPSADAFNGFAQYYTMHSEVFTPVLLDRIKKTATSINDLFPAQNPNKKDHFGDLLILLKKKMNITNS
jgi:hypothetical protein